MANLAKFNASKIKLYGNVQETVDEAKTLVAGNAIIAMNLTYDENITNKTDSLAGDLLDRNTVNSVTDRYGEVSFDTYLPYLGVVSGTTEVATITFAPAVITTNTKFVSTDTITITRGTATGTATVTATFAATSTLTQAVIEIVAYINDGTAGTKFTFTDSAGTGRVGIRAGYLASAGNGASEGKVVLTAITPSTNVANITMSGSTGIADRATLVVTEGVVNSGDVSTIPLAPFLESSSLTQTITYKYGLASPIRNKYNYAATKLVLGITSGNNAIGALTTAIAEATKLRNNLKTGNANRTLAAELKDNLELLKAAVSATVTGTDSLAQTQTELKAAVDTFDNFIVAENSSAALSTLVTDTATALATITAVQTDKVADLSTDPDWGTIQLLLDLDAITVSSTTASGASGLTSATNAKAAVGVSLATAILYAGKTDVVGNLVTYATNDTGTSSAFYHLEYLDGTDLPTAELVAAGVKSVSFSNDAVSETTATYHIRKPSIDLADTEKTVILKDVRSTVDLTITVGERPMLKFNAHGNIDTTSDETAFTYDITSQKTAVADVTTASNLYNASITPTGEAAYSNNICFQKLSVPNFDGFTHTRTQTGCGNFWLPEATAHDFTMTVLEDSATADGITNFNPVDSINKEFTVVVTQKTTVGKRFTVTLTGCTLTNFKNTTVGNVAAQDLTFSFSGRATLLLD